MVGFTLEGSIKRAEKMLRNMADPEIVSADKVIPTTLLRHCEAVAFITIFKAGLFMIGGNVGAGCIIAKIPDSDSPEGYRWSGPAAVACGGFIFGGEKIDSVIILNTKSAVRAFMGKGQVTFGGNVSLAVGPVGRDLGANIGVSDTKEIVAAYSYSQAKGAYIGGTLEGAFMGTDNKNNQKFYEREATAEQILTGEVPVPFKAMGLVNRITDIMKKNPGTSNVNADIVASKGVTPTGQPLSGPSSTTSNGKSLYAKAMSGQFTSGTDRALPPGWEELKAEDGTPYYYNSKTNKTQWDMPTITPTPAVKKVAPPPRPKPPNPTGTQLPPGWEELKAEDGTPYYYNSKTNKTQWEQPTAPAIPSRRPGAV